MWKTTAVLAALVSVSAPAAVLGDPPLKAKTQATQLTPSAQPQKQWAEVNSFQNGVNRQSTTTPASTGKSQVSAISTTGKPNLMKRSTNNKLQLPPPSPKPKKKTY